MHIDWVDIKDKWCFVANLVVVVDKKNSHKTCKKHCITIHKKNDLQEDYLKIYIVNIQTYRKLKEFISRNKSEIMYNLLYYKTIQTLLTYLLIK